ALRVDDHHRCEGNEAATSPRRQEPAVNPAWSPSGQRRGAGRVLPSPGTTNMARTADATPSRAQSTKSDEQAGLAVDTPTKRVRLREPITEPMLATVEAGCLLNRQSFYLQLAWLFAGECPQVGLTPTVEKLGLTVRVLVPEARRAGLQEFIRDSVEQLS